MKFGMSRGHMVFFYGLKKTLIMGGMAQMVAQQPHNPFF